TVCDNNYRRTSLVRPRLVRRSGWFDCSSRACMHRLIDDWPAILFTSSKDEVSIILLGSEDTNNKLNYKNICLAYPLEAPNWNMIEYIEKGIKPSLVDADWFEALILGLDVLKKRATQRWNRSKVALLLVFVTGSAVTGPEQPCFLCSGDILEQS
ncbi:unnamed protein product, partial [Timema podura]|nr:unnamed protein product [Timema podura]